MWVTPLADYRCKLPQGGKCSIILANSDDLATNTNQTKRCAVTLNKRGLWVSLWGVITENRLQGTGLSCHQRMLKSVVWAGNAGGSHLVWTGVVIGPASDHKELSSAAGQGRRADRLLHRSHLCPAVGERVVALNTIEAALAVVSAHCVHLRAATRVTYSVAGKANCRLKFPLENRC